jgi:hypothetical protein
MAKPKKATAKRQPPKASPADLKHVIEDAKRELQKQQKAGKPLISNKVSLSTWFFVLAKHAEKDAEANTAQVDEEWFQRAEQFEEDNDSEAVLEEGSNPEDEMITRGTKCGCGECCPACRVSFE